MPVTADTSRQNVKIFLLFLGVMILAYLPVSSFLFFLKNDAFNNYFPPKFFMSESIAAGHLPLWNPYINFGIPQYADMNSGYWSPVTWLIASVAEYNAYTFTIEALLYITIGGIGMYKLCGYWQLNKKVCLIAGIAFMCSGYNIGHLQHFNWLSGAAFLPWCMIMFLKMNRIPSLKNILTAAILFYLFLASSHPGMIISAAYFFIAIFFYLFFKERKASAYASVKDIIKGNGLMLAVLLLLSAGMAAGYADVIPHFVRGEKIALEESLSNPTNLQSWLSAILPLSTVKNDTFFDTGISMRNCFFGLTLFIFILLAVFKKKNSWQIFLLITGIAFALLSAGGIIKTIAYKFMPMLGYVRLNGEFRIFAILCFIVVAAIELDKYISHNKRLPKLKQICNALLVVLAFSIIYGIANIINTRDSFLYSLDAINGYNSFQLKLKSILDAISFYDTLWIQGSIQIVFLLMIKNAAQEFNIRQITTITILNLIVCSLMNIPYTGAGKASVADVQSVLNKSPQGIPIPPLQPIINNDSLPWHQNELIGDWSFYNKQIGTLKWFPYPITLKNMDTYFRDSVTPAAHFTHKPFVFFYSGNGQLNIENFTPNSIELNVEATMNDNLVLQQNHYPHWYYTNGSETNKVNIAGINFMSAPVTAGQNHLRFYFQPTFVKRMMLLSVISFLITILLIIVLKIRQPSLSSRRQ